METLRELKQRGEALHAKIKPLDAKFKELSKGKERDALRKQILPDLRVYNEIRSKVEQLQRTASPRPIAGEASNLSSQVEVATSFPNTTFSDHLIMETLRDLRKRRNALWAKLEPFQAEILALPKGQERGALIEQVRPQFQVYTDLQKKIDELKEAALQTAAVKEAADPTDDWEDEEMPVFTNMLIKLAQIKYKNTKATIAADDPGQKIINSPMWTYIHKIIGEVARDEDADEVNAIFNRLLDTADAVEDVNRKESKDCKLIKPCFDIVTRGFAEYHHHAAVMFNPMVDALKEKASQDVKYKVELVRLQSQLYRLNAIVDQTNAQLREISSEDEVGQWESIFHSVAASEEEKETANLVESTANIGSGVGSKVKDTKPVDTETSQVGKAKAVSAEKAMDPKAQWVEATKDIVW